MVSAQPTQGAIKPGRIETAYLSARLGEIIPKSAPRISLRAHPVIEDPNADTSASLGYEGFDEFPACGVIGNDIAFEVNPALCGSNGSEPGRIVLGGISQKTY